MVGLWLRLLTAVPGWNHNHNALFLVDILCRASFLHPSTHGETLAMFRLLHAMLVARAEASSRGLLSWVSGGAVPRDPGLPASRRLVPPVPLAGLLRPPVREPLVEGGLWRRLVEQ